MWRYQMYLIFYISKPFKVICIITTKWSDFSVHNINVKLDWPLISCLFCLLLVCYFCGYWQFVYDLLFSLINLPFRFMEEKATMPQLSLCYRSWLQCRSVIFSCLFSLIYQLGQWSALWVLLLRYLTKTSGHLT